MTPRRPLLGGVPWVGSPASTLLLGAPTSRRPRFARLRSAQRFRGSSPRRRRDLPGSWGTLVYMPCSGPTPVGPLCQAIRALPYSLAPRCCLPHIQKRRLPLRTNFGAQSHGLHTRCLRFAAAVTDVHARLASGWWPTLAGRDSNPLGPFARFQLVLHGILLAQASPGAPKLELSAGCPFNSPPIRTLVQAGLTPSNSTLQSHGTERATRRIQFPRLLP
jgi:hypothetical protein